jgi:GT2 family glycosyltransferase
MNPVKVAVVILNWNGEEFLKKFLPSVVEHCPDYARIHIADNGSSDNSVNYLNSNHKDISLIKLDKNYGFTGGYNKALEQIESQYYILLNSDIQVDCDWIGPVIDLMDSDSSIAACQPKIRSYHHPSYFEYAGAAGGFIDFLGYPFCRGRIFQEVEPDLQQYNAYTELFWATGACMFVRASDFHQAGGFDDDFFAHMEEIDLCWRLKRMGKKIVFCPNSQVYHVGGGTLPSNNPRKTFLNFRNSIYLMIKNLPRGKFYPILFFRVILDQIASLKFLFSGQYKDFIAVYKAWFYAVKSFRYKRKQGKKFGYKKVDTVFKKSIVLQFYLWRKKRFSELKSSDFGSL